MAKSLFAADKVLPEMFDVDIDVLAELQKANIPNAQLVDFWRDPRAQSGIYNRLEKLGLIKLENYYEGQCVAVLTELGKSVLHTLSDTYVGIEPMAEVSDEKKE